MKRFFVMRPKDNVEVIIVRNKLDNTYSFVNLTKEHICTCRFESEAEAIDDMRNLKEKGEIINYFEI